MAKEQWTVADTSTKQNLENFQNCNTVSDDVKSQCKKSNLSPEAQQQEQEEITEAKLDHQLKEIR